MTRAYTCAACGAECPAPGLYPPIPMVAFHIFPLPQVCPACSREISRWRTACVGIVLPQRRSSHRKAKLGYRLAARDLIEDVLGPAIQPALWYSVQLICRLEHDVVVEMVVSSNRRIPQMPRDSVLGDLEPLPVPFFTREEEDFNRLYATPTGKPAWGQFWRFYQLRGGSENHILALDRALREGILLRREEGSA